nr:MAG TPA: hypothetical protein [Caudoviricetes sp.]
MSKCDIIAVQGDGWVANHLSLREGCLHQSSLLD